MNCGDGNTRRVLTSGLAVYFPRVPSRRYGSPEVRSGAKKSEMYKSCVC